MQGHGDVEIQGIVVHHADGEEHGDHHSVVPEMQRSQHVTQNPLFQEHHVQEEIFLLRKVFCFSSSRLKECITTTT